MMECRKQLPTQELEKLESTSQWPNSQRKPSTPWLLLPAPPSSVKKFTILYTLCYLLELDLLTS